MKILHSSRLWTGFIRLLAGLSLLLLASISGYAQAPDLILTNGKIFTADTSQLYVQALAIKGNLILATGTNVEIEKLASGKTRKIDLEGRTVVPGFNDAHSHPGWGAPIGKSYTYTEMNPAGLSKAAVLDSVSRLVRIAKPNQWISGLIGTAIFFDTSMRAVLDSIAPNNPVALQTWWGHGLVVNGKALEASGLSDKDIDPVGGWYIRVAGSKKITALQQNAQAPVWFALNTSEPENLIKGMRTYSQKQLQGGITTVQYMAHCFKAAEASHILREANLHQRVRMIAWPRSTPQGRQLSDWELHNTHPTPLTYISGIKYVIDGTPFEENALRTKPYTEGGSWYGRLNYPIDTMKQMLKEALSSNRQLMMHITADSSFSVVLSLMKQLGNGESWRPKRVRIEHNTVGDLSPTQRQMMKDFGMLMMHTPFYGKGSPLRSLLESGVMVGISPDGTTNPFHDIMVVTSQQTNPQENLTREQAVIAYTYSTAYAEFTDDHKGTLTRGKLADLAVLSQDIFTIPTEQLPATRSVLTMVDGKIVYKQL